MNEPQAQPQPAANRRQWMIALIISAAAGVPLGVWIFNLLG